MRSCCLTVGGSRALTSEHTYELLMTSSPCVARRLSDSSFHWASVLDQQTLTGADVLALVDAFDDPDVLACLAGAAERNGDRDTALRLASDALERAPDFAWSYRYGGTKRRAGAITVRLGGEAARVAACQDLAIQATSSRWFPQQLLSEFDSIVEALDAGPIATTIWPEVRTYLDGVAEPLDLADHDVLTDHGCRWWLPAPTGDRRMTSGDSSPAAALAELAVGHLSHPTWLVRDAATTIVIRALGASNEDVAGALNRFVQPDASDDTLERAGRCLLAARSRDGYVIPTALQPLERILASHPSQTVRDLAADQSPMAYRALSPVYALALPVPAVTPGSESVFPFPHEAQYKILAESLGLDHGTLLGVAAQYASKALAILPREEEVKAALMSSQVRHAHPLEELAASRAAFGRVLADLKDARLLDSAPPHVRSLLRTVDIELLSRTPRGRPNVLPAPPAAEHDQTLARWRDEIGSRLEEYVAVSSGQDRVLIGARSRLTVLNWSHLGEEYVCGTAVGTGGPTEGGIFASGHWMILKDLVNTSASRRPEDGEPLIVENTWYPLHQMNAGWLAFRPDLAATLGWAPDLTRPGRWHTAGGDLAVETIWWMDGWWGRAGPAFDDTEAEGHAVVLTTPGLDDVAAVFGRTTRHFELTRRGRDDETGLDVEAVSVTQSLPTA